MAFASQTGQTVLTRVDVVVMLVGLPIEMPLAKCHTAGLRVRVKTHH